MIVYPTPESLEHHPVVPRDQWLIARTELLKEEKEFTRLRDKINARRRDLPWVRVEKNYVFQGPNGPQTLADLFAGRSQLFVKHFMFAPGWKAGCVGCSLDVDHIEGALVHLEHHDVTCVAVSRATLAEIEAFKQRMGWRIPWVSSFGSDFNYDYQVSIQSQPSWELPRTVLPDRLQQRVRWPSQSLSGSGKHFHGKSRRSAPRLEGLRDGQRLTYLAR